MGNLITLEPIFAKLEVRALKINSFGCAFDTRYIIKLGNVFAKYSSHIYP